MSVPPPEPHPFALAAWSASHRGLLAVLVLTCFVALLYGTVVPPFEGPDADAHFGYVAFLRDHPGFPPLDAQTAAISHEAVQQPPLYYGIVALLTSPLVLTPTLVMHVPNPQWPEHSARATLTPSDGPPGGWLPARIAVWVSLVGALLAVVATYGLGRTLFPDRPELAVATAAIVGLNPEFLFSAATITNDTWAAAMSALAVWMAARAVTPALPDSQSRLWAGAACGLALGLALLTKYSCVAALVPVGAIFWFGAKQDRAGTFAALAGLAGGALVTAGWWYAHNVIVYGSPLPLAYMQPLMGGMLRENQASWATVWREADWLLHSYWGVFGYGAVAPAPYVDVTNGLLLGGILGAVVMAIRPEASASDDRPPAASRLRLPVVFIASLWFAAQLAIVLQWMRVVHYGNQGRLLFPAAPALALLIVLGWDRLLPRQVRRPLIAAVPIGMLGLALWQATTLQAAYALPTAIAAPTRFDRPVDAHFAGGMTLLGVDLPDGDKVRRGGVLPVMLYWTTSVPITTSYRFFLHLAGPDDHLYARFDGVPFAGRHDTRQWVPGAVFADRYELAVEQLPPSAPAAVGSGDEAGRDEGDETAVDALLSAGFTDLDTGERIPLLGPNGRMARRPDGQPSAERAELGHVRLIGDRP